MTASEQIVAKDSNVKNFVDILKGVAQLSRSLFKYFLLQEINVGTQVRRFAS